MDQERRRALEGPTGQTHQQRPQELDEDRGEQQAKHEFTWTRSSNERRTKVKKVDVKTSNDPTSATWRRVERVTHAGSYNQDRDLAEQDIHGETEGEKAESPTAMLSSPPSTRS